MKRITSVEDHKLSAAYEGLREALGADKYADRMDKPLAYWALPGDRRLPMALLGRPLGELLSHSLEDLGATPGIGHKKLGSLIKLLHRATKDHPPGVPMFADEPAAKPKGRAMKAERAGFDPALVSEVLWEQWRGTVRRYGLEEESLGRLAPSLYRLPTVIWRTPLAAYLDLTVGEIRRLKTHGEKRVRAILEVFHSIHEMLAHVPQNIHLRVDLRPKFTVSIEQWIHDVLRRSQPPSPAELKQRLLLPILEQMRIDAGPEIFRLLEERLGIKSAPQPVQQQAKRLGVTRARVYQLFEMCGDIMSVRWPEGEELFRQLYEKLSSFPNAKAQLAQLAALSDLVYPKPQERPTIDKMPAERARAGEAGSGRSNIRQSVREGEHRSKSNGAERAARNRAVARA